MASRWQHPSYQSIDADGDGYRINAAGQRCAGAELPAGFFRDTVASSADCDDGDAQTWQVLPYASIDQDSDSHRVNTSGERCSGAAWPQGISPRRKPRRDSTATTRILNAGGSSPHTVIVTETAPAVVHASLHARVGFRRLAFRSWVTTPMTMRTIRPRRLSQFRRPSPRRSPSPSTILSGDLP